ncbi:predicted protein [Histoplasma mississippiense (nom. inval.)]|uniref:predicted protein n=1 Tax=Ajellomyces capsulatus (strain NAm1 / WU24) TaxID=2059318 RepID=UPI000157D434|nr:predicted protein [Histoplasma mississippiense (nom. inval.)]EDN05200.1 predicted protein [Histoplasma mississippiense (nom. inval.)]
MARFQALPDSESETDGDTLSSSMGSFHSFKSARSGLPSPPYSEPPSPLDSRPLDNVEQLQIPPKPIHTRELSEATVVAEPVGLEEAVASWKENRSLETDRVSSPPGHMNGITTSTLTTSPGTAIRQRCLQGPNRHELPPTQSSTSWSPEGGSPVNKMTASILRKTCSLIVARLAHGGESRATNTDESDNHYDGSDSDDGIWIFIDYAIIEDGLEQSSSRLCVDLANLNPCEYGWRVTIWRTCTAPLHFTTLISVVLVSYPLSSMVLFGITGAIIGDLSAICLAFVCNILQFHTI